MRYLVTARVKKDRAPALAEAIDDGTLGRGSVAGDEYFRNMGDARAHDDRPQMIGGRGKDEGFVRRTPCGNRCFVFNRRVQQIPTCCYRKSTGRASRVK